MVVMSGRTEITPGVFSNRASTRARTDGHVQRVPDHPILLARGNLGHLQSLVCRRPRIRGETIAEN